MPTRSSPREATPPEAINKAEAFKEQRIAQPGRCGPVQRNTGRIQAGTGSNPHPPVLLEVLEEILPGMEVYILDEQGNTIRWLPIGGGMQ